jgi:hypothetical protein
MKTIYLSEAELKNILADYIGKYNSTLAHHMAKNHCTLEWVDNNFTISMDGEVVEESIVLPHMAESRPGHHWATPAQLLRDEGDIPF